MLEKKLKSGPQLSYDETVQMAVQVATLPRPSRWLRVDTLLASRWFRYRGGRHLEQHSRDRLQAEV